MNEIIPARIDPTKIIPIVSPAVRPLARLADPVVQAEMFTAAAILRLYQQGSGSVEEGRFDSPECKETPTREITFTLRGWDQIDIHPSMIRCFTLFFVFYFP